RRDTAEIIAVKQVGHAILTQGEHQLRRRRSGYIHKRGADATKISVTLIEREPIRRSPKIAKDRSGLQTNNGFATHPVALRVKGVPGNYKHVSSIAGNS